MWFFKRGNPRESVLLLDVRSSGVGAAYASFEGAVPVLHHAVRIPSKPSIESVKEALNKALALTLSAGAPVLRDATGSARVHRAIVSVGSPWQRTAIETLKKETDAPFTFTPGVLASMTEKVRHLQAGYTEATTAVIATLLNGYEVREPFGRRTTRAAAVVVETSVEEKIAEIVATALREKLHIRDTTFVSSQWLTYGVLRNLYPHEREYVIVDADRNATEVTLVARGLLSRVASAQAGTEVLHGTHPEGTAGAVERGVRVIKDLAPTSALAEGRTLWLEKVVGALTALSKDQALPRTLFLLTEEEDVPFMKTLLDDTTVRSLWLTDTPLSILPVMCGQLTAHVKTNGHGDSNPFLMLMALFVQSRSHELR